MTLPHRHLGVAVIVGVAFALLPLSTDLYLPSLPGLRRQFGVGVAEMQLTLSVFMAAFAVSQLVYGPLSDRHGRRPVLLGGIFIYIVATLACMSAQSIDQLLAARFFQAIGACSGQVLGRAIVRDVHGASGAARMLGYITAGTAMVPVLAPVVGSLLTVSVGWRANFAVMAALAALLLVAVWRLFPESNAHRDPGATNALRIAHNYGVLLRDRRFVGYTLCVGAGFASVFAWISGSAFVMIEVLKVPVSWFGPLFGITVLGYVAANILTGRFVGRLGPARILRAGTALAAASGTLMAGLALAGVQSSVAVLAPVALLLFAMGFNVPCAMAGAIGPFAKIAGTASALMGFIQMTLGAAVGVAVGRLHDGTTVPTALAVCLMTWMLAAVFRLVVPQARPDED